MRAKLFWLLMAGALLLVLAACTRQGGSASDADGSVAAHAGHATSGDSHAGHTTNAPNGDLREETASVDALPGFLDEEADQVKLAYIAASKLQDTLQYIPCYCGCGQSAGHKSNLACFIAGVREDGSVIWDDHGTTCGVCQQIALQSAQKKSEGMSDLQIRQWVDATYGAGGYADPTDTPLPQA
ncbi:PCYCGC motif-containing (lipo)protein [Cohnella sp. 56]|uniref:PCYCGC motif-containing (lipo)protein n=1 Tax=Cohnella sp. 56 TaxID=3113722 RepID=UPI0030E7D295